MAASSFGPWVEGFEVFIALDWDEAGDAALGPTAERAYELGAKQVRRIEWPRGCNDACDLVDQVGLDGLATFLSGVLVEVSR
jgi:DNA primase